MRIFSMNKYNERGNNNLVYIMITIVLALAMFYFLSTLFKAFGIFFSYLFQNWKFVLLGIAGLLVLRKVLFRKRSNK